MAPPDWPVFPCPKCDALECIEGECIPGLGDGRFPCMLPLGDPTELGFPLKGLPTEFGLIGDGTVKFEAGDGCLRLELGGLCKNAPCGEGGCGFVVGGVCGVGNFIALLSGIFCGLGGLSSSV